jgi:hypothetical protein
MTSREPYNDRASIASKGSARDAVLATGTYRDSEGGVRDTDIGCDRPYQSLAHALTPEVVAGPPPQPTIPPKSPSFILRYAEPLSRSVECHGLAMQAATSTFEKSEPGGRDTDISATAASTETHVANPIARDTDIDQLGFAAIGSRCPSISMNSGG